MPVDPTLLFVFVDNCLSSHAVFPRADFSFVHVIHKEEHIGSAHLVFSRGSRHNRELNILEKSNFTANCLGALKLASRKPKPKQKYKK